MGSDGHKQRVLLLHDQFQDARVWGTFASRLAQSMSVETIAVPPVKMSSKTRWAAQLIEYAHTHLGTGAAYELVISARGAANAAARLVMDGSARRAMLIDPVVPAAVFDKTSAPSTDSTDEGDTPTIRRFQNEYLEPYWDEIQSGHHSDESIEVLAGLLTELDSDLPPDQITTLRQMYIDQYRLSMPLTVPATEGPEILDWIDDASNLAGRCQIVLSMNAPKLADRLTQYLSRHSPDMAIARVDTTSTHPWLHYPDHIAELAAWNPR